MQRPESANERILHKLFDFLTRSQTGGKPRECIRMSRDNFSRGAIVAAQPAGDQIGVVERLACA
jgi:hypothetical protein